MTSEAQNTPVSTPSGPSAGLEGQDATQEETQDATEAAQKGVWPTLPPEVRHIPRFIRAEHPPIEFPRVTDDATEAAQGRVEHYAEAIDPGAMDLNRRRSSHAVARRRRALETARAVVAVADRERAEKDATIAELRAEVERLRSWLPPRIVDQPALFGSTTYPRHEVAFTEEMRTYCATCSAAHQDWVTPDECPQFAEMDVPARVVPASRAEAAEAERDRLREALRKVLSTFAHPTHPGRECRQSGHVPVETLRRWQDILDAPKDSGAAS